MSIRDKIEFGVIENHVGFQIALTARAFRSGFRTQQAARAAKPSGWYSALALIGVNGGISQKQLAEALFLDPSIIVGIVDDLERSALATRTRSAADRRRLELHLTEQGEAELERVNVVSEVREATLAANLSEAEHQQLVFLLHKVRATIPG